MPETNARPSRRLGAAALVLTLAACAPSQQVSRGTDTTTGAPLPAMNQFPDRAERQGVNRSNVDIFEEFLDLTFSLESGQVIQRMTRFEGPVKVALVGRHAPQVSHDLDRLLLRLRNEAGMRISRTMNAQAANIIIEGIPKRQLRRAAPNAACIVVPRVESWRQFRRARFSRLGDWSSLEVRDKVSIFMPTDISAQDARDCLHEELAQALGPLNDLYRLPDSVYNDDNFNIVLSAYDMLILRITYAPELRSGMSKGDVAAVLPKILARTNPGGNSIPPRNLPRTSGDWTRAIEAALGVNAGTARRRAEATRAVNIALRDGMTDHRLGFSYYARARVSAADDPENAAKDYARAYALFVNAFGPHDIHTAQAALQMASLAMSSAQFSQALEFIEPAILAARQAENGRLLFALLAMKAEIFRIAGRQQEAQALRQEAIAWGRYGIQSKAEIDERLALISRLPPQLPPGKKKGGS